MADLFCRPTPSRGTGWNIVLRRKARPHSRGARVSTWPIYREAVRFFLVHQRSSAAHASSPALPTSSAAIGARGTRVAPTACCPVDGRTGAGVLAGMAVNVLGNVLVGVAAKQLMVIVSVVPAPSAWLLPIPTPGVGPGKTP